jgi:hypothetical protein
MNTTGPVMLTLAALLCGSAAEAQTLPATADSQAVETPGTTRRLLSGVRIDEAPPVIDGRLDEAVWARAEPATAFVQMRPGPGEPATERTEARVLYDDDALFVGMRMHDAEPDAIAAQLARRDAANINSDWAHVLIDSYHDRRTGFRFSVNPRGVQKDVLHYDDYMEDTNWDAVWTVATSRDSSGWTAEFRIPLSQLRFAVGDADATDELVWGLNFGREIARRGESAWWSPVLPTGGGFVSQAGTLLGLTGLTAPGRLELLPYSVARVTRAPGSAENPFFEPNDGQMSFGADMRYGLTSNLTLTATINPDFGQVEADPAVVNLSAFESYFGEKRPFFMEGGNLFAFGVGTDDGSGEGLFYSRRIGRAPQRWVDAGDGWVDRPEATTILGAAKLTGRTAGGWSIGFLDAVTAAEDARVATPAGPVTDEPIEPMTNYSVLSLSRDFRDGRSTLGVMGTGTHRRLADDEFDLLREAAYSGGIRARHRFASDTWEASGYLAGSHIAGSESAIARVQTAAGHYFQRPDADHLDYDPARTSLTGAVASFWVGKNGGGPVRGGFGGHLRTPGLELNDLGFMGEADQVQVFGNLSYNRFQPIGIFRSFNFGINPFSMWSTGGERIYTQIGHWSNFELRNLWSAGWWVGKQFEARSISALRGGPSIVRPGGLRYSVWLNSDRRRAVTFNPSMYGGYEEDSGRWDYGISPSVRVRPTSMLDLSLTPGYNRLHQTWQYVTQLDAGGERRYVFAALDQRTASLTARLNYTITPMLSFELYAQPFVSAGRYGDFMEVADPGAARFADRFDEYGSRATYDADARVYRVDADGDGVRDFSVGDPDFNFKQLRSNAVLRWEYRPGSTLFVVWGQGRTRAIGDGSFSLERDFSDLMDAPATNVLLVKLNYWLNF